MQANNSPEWKDDAAFWDDAWKDMQQRLDEEPQKRRPVFWWWLGLGTSLLVFTAVAFWFLPSFRSEPSIPTSEPIQLREASVLETPIAASEEIAPVTKAAAKEENLQSAAAQSNIANQISHIAYPENLSSPPKAAAKLTPNEGNLSPTPLQRSEATEDAKRPDGSGLTETDLQHAAAQSKIENPEHEVLRSKSRVENPLLAAAQSNIASAEGSSEANPIPHIAYNQASPLIPGKEIKPLVPALSLPEVSPIRQRPKSRFDLLAGGTLSTAFEKPGYFAGISYTLPSRGKISFPISLRYRFDALEITELDGSRLSPPTTVTGSGQPDAFDERLAAEGLLSDLAISNFNELRSSGMELRAGMAWRAAPRLRLSGHGGLQYLFSARGPSISSQENTFADLSGTERYVDLNIGGLFSNEFDLVSSPVSTPNANTSSPVSVNRWALRAGLTVDYQLTGRLGVFAGGQYLLTPIYQQQAAELRKGQLEAGVTWRIW